MISQAATTSDKVKNITTATTTVIASGPGILRRIIINTGANGTAAIYDGTDATGPTIGTITSATSDLPTSITYDAVFLNGLTIITSAAMDLTVLHVPSPVVS